MSADSDAVIKEVMSLKELVMPKFLPLLLAVVFCGLVGSGICQIEDGNNDKSDLNRLKTKRLELLQERVTIVEEHVDRGRSSSMELVEPTIDFLIAKIEYASSNADRKELYNQLLKNHDKLIEMAEIRGRAPVSVTKTNLELLYLKSERIRIEIERDSLE